MVTVYSKKHIFMYNNDYVTGDMAKNIHWRAKDGTICKMDYAVIMEITDDTINIWDGRDDVIIPISSIIE